jgi:hypothetical protein
MPLFYVLQNFFKIKIEYLLNIYYLPYQDPILSGATLAPTSQSRASAMLLLLIVGN